MSKKIEICLEASLYDKQESLPAITQALLKKAQDACKTAYAPYSNFWVGAAFLLSDGEIIIGNNQENAAYPSGLCAERTAVYWLGANRPGKKIEALAIAARRAGEETFIAITPCGACRQALLEYENKQQCPIKIVMQAENGGFFEILSIQSLLPFQFNAASLRSQ
jgi:cytidine deaminase